ncbi:MAG: head GIN domain-containing protein [Bacteroidota bacterium]
MKKVILNGLLALAILAVPALANAQSRSYDERNFTGVNFGIPGTLTVKQGNSYSVELSGDDDDLDKVEVKVKGNRLIIKTKSNSWSRLGRITGTVTLPEIESLGVSGSGTLKSQGTLNTDDLSLAVSGSGDMEVSISSEDVTVAVSGSGEIEVEGDCEDLGIAISGSGGLEADELEAKDVGAAISGSGEAYVNVSGKLEARISGSGDVYYTGNPTDIDSRVSGSGNIRRKN